MITRDLGAVTAYAYAVENGYVGTEEEFGEMLGQIADALSQIENLSAQANTLSPGSSATATYANGVITFGIPRGDTGATGATGNGIASIAKTGSTGTNPVVDTYTITYTNGQTATFTVTNGVKGDTGNGIQSIYLTGTSGAVKTYTILYTDGTTTTFEVTDGEVTEAVLEQTLEDYAKIDGAYEQMTVGNAEQLVSTVYEEDSEPYFFRTSGGSIDIGDREYDTIVGGSVAWNQHVMTSGSGGTVNGITFTNNGDGSWSVSGTASADAYMDCAVDVSSIPVGHKMFIRGCPSGGSTSTYMLFDAHVAYTNSSDTGNGRVYNKSTANLAVRMYVWGGTAISGTLKFRPQITDLTLAFNSTIADYIYTLEQGTAGAGVAWLRHYGFLTKPYYAYNAGGLEHVTVSAHKTVGFNQWDEEWELGMYSSGDGSKVNDNTHIRCKNPIPVLPNTTYYFNMGGKNTSVCYYDAGNNFISNVNSFNNAAKTTPANCYYLTFNMAEAYGTTYKNDICINIAWDNSRNGEYEPYQAHTYPLDSSLTLRGIPKKDGSGKLYFDGDTYEADGTVTRRYGIVDLGTLNWSYNSYSPYKWFYTRSLEMVMPNGGASVIANILTDKYVTSTYVDASNNASLDKVIWADHQHYIGLRDLRFDTSATPVQDLVAALQGVYLVYELATPTTEQADPFASPQIVDNWGTEEYVSTGLVPIGHNTKYTPNLREKVETLPNVPSNDGAYLLLVSGGQYSYTPFVKELPQLPSANGTYTLKCTVSGGVATLSWVSD